MSVGKLVFHCLNVHLYARMENAIANGGPKWSTPVANFLVELYACYEAEKAEYAEKQQRKAHRRKILRTDQDLVQSKFSSAVLYGRQ